MSSSVFSQEKRTPCPIKDIGKTGEKGEV